MRKHAKCFGCMGVQTSRGSVQRRRGRTWRARWGPCCRRCTRGCPPPASWSWPSCPRCPFCPASPTLCRQRDGRTEAPAATTPILECAGLRLRASHQQGDSCDMTWTLLLAEQATMSWYLLHALAPSSRGGQAGCGETLSCREGTCRLVLIRHSWCRGDLQGLCEAPHRLWFSGRKAFRLLQVRAKVLPPSCRGRCGRTGTRPPLTRPTAGCRSSVNRQTTCTSWILARSASTQPLPACCPVILSSTQQHTHMQMGLFSDACGQRWPHQHQHQPFKQCHPAHLQLMPQACAPGSGFQPTS